MSESCGVRVTVGIVTKNRPDDLRKCLTSLALVADVLGEVIVVDDTSETDLSDAIAAAPASVSSKLRSIYQRHHEGYIVARNRIVREATTEFVLLMDDDAWLLDAESVPLALSVIARDDRVAAVACAMATPDGSPWDARTQPSSASYACYVPSFIGFAHVLRRSVFLALDGYRERFHYYGEEKDYCRRVLAAGHAVVYVPRALVAHLPNPGGRDMARYLRYVSRNDCLCALYNDPFPLVLGTLAWRLAAYFRMRRHWRVSDRRGFWWVLGEVVAALPSAARERTPMRFSDVRRWRELRRLSPPYRLPASA